MYSMTIYLEIVSLLEYLVENKPEQCPDKKHVTIQLTEDTGGHGGNIQIDAVGSWIQGFCVRKFKTAVWNDYSTVLTVHHGDSSVGNYQRYSVTNTSISVQLVYEPYVEECEHYVSFVLSASKYTLHQLHPRLKTQVRVLAARHRDVRITFSVCESLWRLDDTHGRCARMISEAVATVIRYTASLNFQNGVCALLQAHNTPTAVQTMYNLLYECNNTTTTTTTTTNTT